MQESVPIRLQIDMVQTDTEGDETGLALYTAGSYRQDGDAHLLEYEDTSPGGIVGTTRLQLQGGQVLLTRSQDPTSQMFFKAGMPSQNRVESPQGRLNVDVFPLTVQYGIDENGGEVRLVYELSADGQAIGVNHLHLKFSREKAPS